jgi:hypothetical protein
MKLQNDGWDRWLGEGNLIGNLMRIYFFEGKVEGKFLVDLIKNENRGAYDKV